MRPFRWIIDAWLRFSAWWTQQRNFVALIDQERERHRREVEFLKSSLALKDMENKGLLSILETIRAEQDKTMAVLGRQTAEAQYSLKRPSAGGPAT